MDSELVWLGNNAMVASLTDDDWCDWANKDMPDGEILKMSGVSCGWYVHLDIDARAVFVTQRNYGPIGYRTAQRWTLRYPERTDRGMKDAAYRMCELVVRVIGRSVLDEMASA